MSRVPSRIAEPPVPPHKSRCGSATPGADGVRSRSWSLLRSQRPARVDLIRQALRMVAGGTAAPGIGEDRVDLGERAPHRVVASALRIDALRGADAGPADVEGQRHEVALGAIARIAVGM